MNIEEFREYCIQKKAVTESFPFDQSVLVFKVHGKIFVLINIDTCENFNAKCNPERAIQLRAEYPGIQPGYHMNKQHWNTISLDGSVPDSLIRELIDHSYQLIFDKLPKSIRETS